MRKGEYTPTKKKIYDICRLMNEHLLIEIKVRCPWCGEYAMLLKEKNAHYWCTNCKAEGSLNELESELHRRIMEQVPRGE